MYSQIHLLYPKRAFFAGAAIADQTLAVSTAAVAPTGYAAPGTPGAAGVPLVTFDVQTSNLRCRWDGTNPTSTTGHLLLAGSSYTWDFDMYNNAKFIRDTLATVDGSIWASAVSY